MNLTPPLSCLYPASLDRVKSWTSVSASLHPGLTTMYVAGSSDSSVERCTPTTAQSATLGCKRRTASSSVGATWKPRTLINSWKN